MQQRHARWALLPLALVVVTLVGSVLIPARQTWRILHLLRETTDVVERSRLLNARFELDLTKESSALEGYGLSGDTSFLVRYRAARDEEGPHFAALDSTATRLGPEAAARVTAIRSRLAEWQQSTSDLSGGRVPRSRLDPALGAQRASYDALLHELGAFTAYLAAQSADRREQIRDAERRGLVANASLVLIALAALCAVAALSSRERHLTDLLRRRVREEAGLRGALERIVSSRSRLMRGFSHDVKNPLIAAEGHAALLADGIHGPLAGKQDVAVQRIRRCIHSALALIDNLHGLARAEAGYVALTLAPVDAVELAATAVDDFRAAAVARGLELTLQPAPPLTINTDADRVRQIIGNLVSNAIKYTAVGSVTLRLRRGNAADHGERDRWACLEVTDTGPGIPPEKREAIFEEFIRLGNNDAPGAGLGLAISQRLAEALGGWISVASEVGRGSTFSLWLPLTAGDGPTYQHIKVPDTGREELGHASPARLS